MMIMSWLQGLPTDLIRNIINVGGVTVKGFKIKFLRRIWTQQEAI